MAVIEKNQILFSADGPTGATAAQRIAPETQSAVGLAAPGQAPVVSKSKRNYPRIVILAALVLGALFFGGRYAYDFATNGWYLISTDDAYVQADVANVSAKVGGFIKSFPVAENTAIKPDTVIAEIDDGDYVLALQAAVRKAATQRSTIERFNSQLGQADAAIGQAQAQLDSADANAKRMESEFQRYSQLNKEKFETTQKVEQALADRDQARANVANAKAALVSAQSAKQVIVAQQNEARHTLDEYQVSVDKAQRDLDFTKVRSAVGGVFGNKSSNVGALIQPGTRLGALVADESLYVAANFKETQIRDVHPGQQVSIQVDALGGRTLHGTVESFAPGTGSQFSLLPPENATGNFTKVVQRIPVRIALPAGERTVQALRPGLSVIVTIDTRTGGSGGSSVAAEMPAK